MTRTEAVEVLAPHEVARLRAELREAQREPDPMVQLTVRDSFIGVLNSYLERRLAELGHSVEVRGEVEPLEPCPCCGYLTLGERGDYELCVVCFWEDDGVNEPGHHSGPNHMTLGEGRRNFERLGAISEESVVYVLRDGRERYPRSPRRST